MAYEVELTDGAQRDLATWHYPIEHLSYPGDDSVGERWERPPLEVHVPDSLPADRPPLICVLGSSGFKGSWQAGICEVIEELSNPVRWDLASGGTIPGLACAAGINRRWRRVMNAGVPSYKVLRRVGGLQWFERKNLDLAGVYDLSEVEKWLEAWLAWAGVATFRDLRYRPSEPRPVGVRHRAGVSVVMWRTRRPFPDRCTPQQLRDPSFVHKAFRWAFFGRQFPFKQFRQVWVPDDIGEHLPWLADEIDDHSPAWWARVSMSQWPACLPTVLQDPETLQLVFLSDGGHIDNQPSLFNDGRPVSLPLINPRLAQNRRQSSNSQLEHDRGRMPYGRVVRFEVTAPTRWNALRGHHLTWADRDAMWLRGVEQGRDRLPYELKELVRAYSDSLERAPAIGLQPMVETPMFHGFQAIAAARRAGTKRVFGLRS